LKGKISTDSADLLVGQLGWAYKNAGVTPKKTETPRKDDIIRSLKGQVEKVGRNDPCDSREEGGEQIPKTRESGNHSPREEDKGGRHGV